MANCCIKNSRNGTFTTVTGGGAPITQSWPLHSDVSISGMSGHQTELTEIKCRGKLVAVQKGDEIFATISVTFKMESFVEQTHNALATPFEMVHFEGDYSAAESVASAPTCAELNAVDVILTYPACSLDDADSVITAAGVVWTDYSLNATTEMNTVTLTGTIYGGHTRS